MSSFNFDHSFIQKIPTTPPLTPKHASITSSAYTSSWLLPDSATSFFGILPIHSPEQQPDEDKPNVAFPLVPHVKFHRNSIGGLTLDSNFTDIASLRNYLLSLVYPAMSECPSSPLSSSSTLTSSSASLSIRNRRFRRRPVNLFERFYELDQQRPSSSNPSPTVGRCQDFVPLFFQQWLLRQQTVLACIHTYFDCWVRYFPVFPRQHILAILDQRQGLDAVLVNAIACFVLKHMFAHHAYPPSLAPMRNDPTKIRQMEEFFFSAAKRAVEPLLDGCPASRHDILGLLLMAYKVDMKKKNVYMTLAVHSLRALKIQPASYHDQAWQAELDTRLWWMVWMNDFAVYTSGAASLSSKPFCLQQEYIFSQPVSASTPLVTQPESPGEQEQKTKWQVPRLWSFDCDGASEYGVMVNQHCLSVWRLQARIVNHQDDDDEVSLVSLDQDLTSFVQQLPVELQPEMPIEPSSPLTLVRARVLIEVYATRIILHKLYIPDEDDILASRSIPEQQWASLNVCVHAAMSLVTLFNDCVIRHPETLRCGFDRDELWRASDILSMALDFLAHYCDTAVTYRILSPWTQPLVLVHTLQQALIIIQHTYEYQCNNTNFCQLEHWLRLRIQHHQQQPFHFSASLSYQRVAQQTATSSTGMLPIRSRKKRKLSPVPPPLTSTSESSTTHFYSPATPLPTFRVPNNSSKPAVFQQPVLATPTPTPSSSSNTKARFRYFSPKKHDGLVFIDENPQS
ncbi:hypothetical protein DM01DRAFT_1334215 [Hesseltinella vesiculosa]|uniref:Transcription factor domain-containing protein n=1 Tax=Hesseltinella vesiculosa TaxID=101127 RepID=A0A1X2GN12_9FUNG|nr:hypothetical protein DM01DRAFT_1334215 [Hesseltinella vesiculosa]